MYESTLRSQALIHDCYRVHTQIKLVEEAINSLRCVTLDTPLSDFRYKFTILDVRKQLLNLTIVDLQTEIKKFEKAGWGRDTILRVMRNSELQEPEKYYK